MNQKQFIESGHYMVDEVKRIASNHGSHFFDVDSMRFFSSRVSELCWKSNDLIWFVTSEADNYHIKHSGSTRAFTVRTCDIRGNIDTVGKFQGHENLREARKAIMEATQ